MLRFLMVGLVGVLAGCAAEGEFDAADNQAPVANAGPDITVAQGDVVELSGSRSVDLDGDPLTYRWGLVTPIGSNAKLINTNGENTQFTADAAGEYKVSLIVSDGTVDSPLDNLLVTATPRTGQNTAPVASAGNNVNVQRGMTVQLDGTGSSDADGDPLSFQWSIDRRPAGSQAVLSSDRAPRPAFIADVDGAYEISLVVSDGYVDSAPSELVVTAFSNNTPPVANAGPDQTVALGSRVQLDGSTSFDPDGSEVSYQWTLVTKPAGSNAALSVAASPTPSFDADVEGDFVFELVVNDGELSSEPDVLTITSSKNNLPPVAHAGLNQTVSVGQTVTLSGVQSYDSNDDAMTFKWSWVSKPNTTSASFSSATTSNPTFVADVEGEYIAQLIVNDGSLDSAPDSVTIIATLANVPPIANAGSDQALTTGTPVMLDGAASSDADGNTLTYAWTFTGPPQGSAASLTGANTRTPSFTPDVDGTYVIQLVVNDGIVDSAADSVVVSASTPTLPAPSSEGDLVITEIMADPDVSVDSVGEWFEVYNPTSTMWDLKNCVISDDGTDSQIIGSTVTVGPGEYRTFARSANPGFSPDYVYGTYSLANSNDEVILTCNGTEIAQVAYTGTFPYASGASMQLSASKYDEQLNDAVANWCASTMVYATSGAKTDAGTPGAANSVCP